jgi:hypothetical protein
MLVKCWLTRKVAANSEILRDHPRHRFFATCGTLAMSVI